MLQRATHDNANRDILATQEEDRVDNENFQSTMEHENEESVPWEGSSRSLVAQNDSDEEEEIELPNDPIIEREVGDGDVEIEDSEACDSIEAPDNDPQMETGRNAHCEDLPTDRQYHTWNNEISREK